MPTEITSTTSPPASLLNAEPTPVLGAAHEVGQRVPAAPATPHALTLLGEIQLACDNDDLAAQHDVYAHRQLTD